LDERGSLTTTTISYGAPDRAPGAIKEHLDSIRELLDKQGTLLAQLRVPRPRQTTERVHRTRRIGLVIDQTVVVPLKLLAELRHGCLATVRLAKDGWEPGDEHAARAALERIPVWLSDQCDAFDESHRQSSLAPERCAKCGQLWPCELST
jgi:hypothetical protein